MWRNDLLNVVRKFCEQPSSVLINYVASARKVIREILLEKVKITTIDEVATHMSSLTVSDFEYMSL